METKFTPGPWASGIRPDGTMWLSLGDPRKGPHFQGDISCGKNDLPLITASPDLYEALVAMTVNFASPDYMQEWREKSRKALAKARGEA